jgi:hypothetical protein
MNSTNAEANVNYLPPWFFDEMMFINVVRMTLGTIAIFGHTFILHLYLRFKKLRENEYDILVGIMICFDLITGQFKF